jgi:rRNA pseudouridine-1189 N-methylase Emg1 (Nep1/Mra1 family)
MVMLEIDCHESVREGLEAVIKKRDKQIVELEETLSIPRQHYKFIERLTTEETINQKNEILAKMSVTMGVPVD